MPEQTKIDLALQEIGHSEIRATLKDGVIVSIPAQQVLLRDKHGIKTMAIIERTIER